MHLSLNSMKLKGKIGLGVVKKTHYLVVEVGFFVRLQHLIFLLALLQTCNYKLYLFCMKTLMKNDLYFVYFTLYILDSKNFLTSLGRNLVALLKQPVTGFNHFGKVDNRR